MTTFTWSINDLMTQTIEGKQDYVVVADYTLLGVDGTYTASVGGISRFSTEDTGVFIPYEDLTEDIVIGWVKGQLGENGIISLEACIQGQINSMINPPQSPVITPLPWG